MRDRARRRVLDALPSVERAVLVEEPFASVQQDGHDDHVQLVEQAGARVLPDGRHPAAQADVPTAGRFLARG